MAEEIWRQGCKIEDRENSCSILSRIKGFVSFPKCSKQFWYTQNLIFNEHRKLFLQGKAGGTLN
jgi:hypothetical protein